MTQPRNVSAGVTPVWRRREALAALACAMPLAAHARQAPDAPGAAPLPAGEPPVLTPEQLVVLDLSEDPGRRMRVSVRVDGRGPFPFLVDTGADHSVLSTELAQGLGLPDAGAAQVHGIAGAQMTRLVRVGRLEVGGRRLEQASLAVLPRESMGALGIVGLDLLAGQNVAIDFRRRTMSVQRSRGFAEEAGAIVVRGKARFGRLMLVDSSVRHKPIYVVLDSGAQNTLGNDALRRLLNDRRRVRNEAAGAASVALTSVTGQVAWGDVDEMPELDLGSLTLRHVPIIYADLHTFRMYKLIDEPALLLGMDTLRSFARVGIDFNRRDVSFELV